MASDVVLDASVVLRALLLLDPAARDWLSRIGKGEVAAQWPSLVYVEVADAVVRARRARRLRRSDAAAVIELTRAVPARSVALETLVADAWLVADARRLSASDACYVVLAEATGAPLVTADRRLAAATANAVLITD